MESYLYWNTWGDNVGNPYLTTSTGGLVSPEVMKRDYLVNAFTLSELPEVLKKVGEKLGKEDDEENLHGQLVVGVDDIITYKKWWCVHYLKCCELHALGQNVDDYLMELLK